MTVEQTQTLKDLPDAAAELGVSVKTLRRLIAKEAIPVYRIGWLWRIDVNEVKQATKRNPTTCCTNEATSIGLTSRSAKGELDVLLERLTGKKQKHSIDA